MQTIDRKVNSKVPANQVTSANNLWITTMNALDEELERMNKLFSAAGFMLSERDFQSLFRLRQSHIGLKAKMTEYFRKFRDPRRSLSRNTRRSQIETRDNVQLELQDLSSRLQKFIDKLLKASVRSRGFL